MNKPELLLPASCPEVLRTAIRYGADAVYIGGELYGLRAKAKNFSNEDMAESIRFAHEHGRKVYVTANITAHNRDLSGIKEYFRELSEIKPDALFISDPGVFELAGEYAPGIDRHISTQANNTNWMTYKFWKERGATRVVSARELSIDEIAEIRRNTPDGPEIETFVHGAMCISYSGRCLLSNYFTGRDANLGACTHPCRWKYYLMEESRPGEYLPVFENERGTYIFNSKDLCMIEHIPELVNAGIDSFKIEGRMKTALYVATVAGTYRKAIDDYFESPEKYIENLPLYRENISKCTYRNFTTGFFFNKPGADAQVYDNNVYVRDHIYYGMPGMISAKGEAVMEQKNKFSVGDILEVMHFDGTFSETEVLEIKDEDGNSMGSCPHARQKIYVRFSVMPQVGEILRGKGTEDGGLDEGKE